MLSPIDFITGIFFCASNAPDKVHACRDQAIAFLNWRDWLGRQARLSDIERYLIEVDKDQSLFSDFLALSLIDAINNVNLEEDAAV